MNLILSPADIAALSPVAAEKRHFPGTPFSVQVLNAPAGKPGTWPTKIVAVYRDGTLLGGYQRLYPSHATDTFAPFQWEGQWYALYSADYTCTRVLRLNEHSLEDWCGEEPAGHGFCPVDYFLPQAFKVGKGEDELVNLEDRQTYKDYAEFARDAEEYGEGLYYPGFGFLCGCIWGDDGSWKLRYVDYTRVAEKQLLIDERFGYFELAPQPLNECIGLGSWEPNFPIIHAHKRETFCLRTPAGTAHVPSQE